MLDEVTHGYTLWVVLDQGSKQHDQQVKSILAPYALPKCVNEMTERPPGYAHPQRCMRIRVGSLNILREISDKLRDSAGIEAFAVSAVLSASAYRLHRTYTNVSAYGEITPHVSDPRSVLAWARAGCQESHLDYLVMFFEKSVIKM